MVDRLLVSVFLLVLVPSALLEGATQTRSSTGRPSSYRITAIHKSGTIHRLSLSAYELQKVSPSLRNPTTARVTSLDLQPLFHRPEEFKAFAVEPSPSTLTTTGTAAVAGEAKFYVPLPDTSGQWRSALKGDLENKLDLRMLFSDQLRYTERKFRQIDVQKANGALDVAIDEQKPQSLVDVNQVINTPDIYPFGMVGVTKMIIHHGESLPEEWMPKIVESNNHYVRVTRGSPNTTDQQRLEAAELAERPLSRDKTKVFNALPDVRPVRGFLGTFENGT